MTFATVISTHDVKIAIMPFKAGIRVHFQSHVSIFRVTEFLYIPVPVPDADKKFFNVVARRIDAEAAVVDLKLQNSIVHERAHLWSYINTVIAGAIFRSYKLSALSSSDS